MKMFNVLMRFRLPLLLGLVLASSAPAATPADPFKGRWEVTMANGRPGWLEVHDRQGWLDSSLLWGSGSVTPLASTAVYDGKLVLTRVRELPRRDASGKVIRTHQLTDTLTVEQVGDGLKGVMVSPREDGLALDRMEFTARRLPPLPPRPDLGQVKFGPPIALLNGRDLAGWRLTNERAPSAWVVENGELQNRPVQKEGQPRIYYANLRTDAEFEDFNLTLEVNVPARSNSGVYLRGVYEIQVVDSHGKPLNALNMGALYSRITPSGAAERPAGEWQSLDITLVHQHVTVVLNGTKIIDNAPVEGITGGALWPDGSRPGPIYLQGDHGPVTYRNLVLRPVVK